MAEIKILDYFPIILTKEKWQSKTPFRQGAIIQLPQDAILIKPKESTDV